MTRLTIVLLFLCSLSVQSQTDFKWEKIDSTKVSKEVLYSKTKQFIATTWRSAPAVIQNDDKEAGNIILKGNAIVNQYFMLNDHRYTFQYTVRFDFKDRKYRLKIEDVVCIGAVCGTNEWPKLPVADNYPDRNAMTITGMGKKNYLAIMDKLRGELQGIFDSYNRYISSTVVEDKW